MTEAHARHLVARYDRDRAHWQDELIIAQNALADATVLQNLQQVLSTTVYRDFCERQLDTVRFNFDVTFPVFVRRKHDLLSDFRAIEPLRNSLNPQEVERFNRGQATINALFQQLTDDFNQNPANFGFDVA